MNLMNQLFYYFLCRVHYRFGQAQLSMVVLGTRHYLLMTQPTPKKVDDFKRA